ncbi:MAG: hypothetical protein ACON39_04210 [Coraliomargaritaceae bacterium]
MDIPLRKLGVLSKRKHIKKPAAYAFKAHTDYTLTLSGRSKRFNVDRIILHHKSETVDFHTIDSFKESKAVHVDIQVKEKPILQAE